MPIPPNKFLQSICLQKNIPLSPSKALKIFSLILSIFFSLLFILNGSFIITSPLNVILISLGVCLGAMISIILLYKIIHKKFPLLSFKQKLPFPTEAIEALDYSLKLLTRSKTSIIPFDWETTIPPINNDISLLMTLQNEKFNEIKTLINLDDSGGFTEPVDWEEFNRLMKEYIQIGFTTSIFTLNDLPKFLEHNKTSQRKTLVDALVDKKGGLYKTFFACPIAYQFYRLTPFNNPGGNLYDNRSVERNLKFYQKGTTENYCRLLFNHLKKQVEARISLKQLKKRDVRFFNHIIQDLSLNTYRYIGPYPV